MDQRERPGSTFNTNDKLEGAERSFQNQSSINFKSPKLGTVPHTCNPSYTIGLRQEDNLFNANLETLVKP